MRDPETCNAATPVTAKSRLGPPWKSSRLGAEGARTASRRHVPPPRAVAAARQRLRPPVERFAAQRSCPSHDGRIRVVACVVAFFTPKANSRAPGSRSPLSSTVACTLSHILDGFARSDVWVLSGRVMLTTNPARSRLMARVRQRGTAPELVVRSLLRKAGTKYRLNAKDLPGSPDIVHRGRRKAIFVHGCFWHRHPGCSRSTTPKQNFEFWQEKFDKNIQRDERNLAELRREGYYVLVVWECETLVPDPLEKKLRAFWACDAKPTDT